MGSNRVKFDRAKQAQRTKKSIFNLYHEAVKNWTDREGCKILHKFMIFGARGTVCLR